MIIYIYIYIYINAYFIISTSIKYYQDAVIDRTIIRSRLDVNHTVAIIIITKVTIQYDVEHNGQ